MSARATLLAQLADVLGKPFKVVEEPPGSDARFPSAVLVTVQRAGASPSPVGGGWANSVLVYVVVPHETYSKAEDALDEHLPTLVAVLMKLGYAVATIDRDVFFQQGDSPGLHGYRINVPVIADTV